MQFVTYRQQGAVRLGVLEGDKLVDVAAGDLGAALEQGVDLIAAGKAALASGAPRLALAGIEYAVPVTRPGKIVCLGLNYYDHAKEGGREKPEYPWFFYRGASSFVAHGQPGLRPRVSERFDYEAEMAVIIGKKAKHL